MRNFSLLDAINRLVFLVAITLAIILVIEWNQPLGNILLGERERKQLGIAAMPQPARH